ncbi:hypothetical protein [Streptomyces sp. NPDC059176]|uniref:DUF6197 family protein n=1 Tax=Streptomyces sp. NPDC059176 TaxID=3346758 RepID=UPI0036959DFD
MTTQTATRQQTPPTPLSFDERLALAAMAVDARIDSTPLDLADVIRIPVEEPEPGLWGPFGPGDTAAPLAAVLHRAHARITRDGWTTGHCRTQHAVCAYEAIRAEAASPTQAADACAVLLDTIRREYPAAATVPAWNDAQTDPGTVLRMLDQAARDASQRGI